MLGFRLLRGDDTGVNIVRQLAILVGDLFAEGEFPGGVLLASGALVDHAQVVVRRGIPGLQLNGYFGRPDRVAVLAASAQGAAQADERVGKSAVQFRGAPETLDGFGVVPVLARQLTQHVLSARVGRIDLQLGLKLMARLPGGSGGRWFREEDLAQAVMHARQLWILFEYLAVFGGGIIPLALRFQSLRIQLVHLVRARRRVQERLRGADGEIGVDMCRNVERSEERRVGKEGRSRWSPYH